MLACIHPELHGTKAWIFEPSSSKVSCAFWRKLRPIIEGLRYREESHYQRIQPLGYVGPSSKTDSCVEYYFNHPRSHSQQPSSSSSTTIPWLD